MRLVLDLDWVFESGLLTAYSDFWKFCEMKSFVKTYCLERFLYSSGFGSTSVGGIDDKGLLEKVLIE